MTAQTHIDSRFGAKSSTDEVLDGIDLRGKLAVVTGGGQGIGLPTSLAFARAGADVVIGGRNLDRLNAAKAQAASLSPATGNAGAVGSITAVPLDLFSLSSIDAFADAIEALGRPVEILVHNAGINVGLSRNDLGIEAQLMVNCLGPAALTSRLHRLLAEAAGARVIMVASHGHQWSQVIFDDLNFEHRDYNRWLSYGQSKTGAIYVTLKVAEAMKSKGVDAFVLHPGAITTNIGQDIPEEELGWLIERGAIPPASVWKTLDQGASTTVWAATEPMLAGKSPLYLEDCSVAPIIDAPTAGYGVMGYALDQAAANRLWTEAARLLGRELPL